MLVLSRKMQQRVFILAPGQDGGPPTEIVVTVVDIDRGEIRLGIEAPRDVKIYREELLPNVEDRQ